MHQRCVVSKEAYPDSRHQGLDVQGVWPPGRHHDTTQVLYPRHVVTGGTSDANYPVLLISWVVVISLTMGSIWILSFLSSQWSIVFKSLGTIRSHYSSLSPCLSCESGWFLMSCWSGAVSSGSSPWWVHLAVSTPRHSHQYWEFTPILAFLLQFSQLNSRLLSANYVAKKKPKARPTFLSSDPE